MQTGETVLLTFENLAVHFSVDFLTKISEIFFRFRLGIGSKMLGVSRVQSG
ncbi:hypothetical protein M595_3290 [Lyngbya aestuarii BL J]|uniref:Uncharacterized protein n=1 Tax=Lyngbya aestuarii BL J TaxID=1348334 RepID=U7QI41_9CYAN|nr:hypothetical protein M595_3290 [Lyngbya aestuarii BL J]